MNRVFSLILLCICIMYAVAKESQYTESLVSPLRVLDQPKKHARVSSQKRVELSLKAEEKWRSRQTNQLRDVQNIHNINSRALSSAAYLRQKRIDARTKRSSNRVSTAPVYPSDERPHERMSPSSFAQGVAKVRELLKHQSVAIDAGIYLDPASFAKYLMQGSRPYHSIVTFTALGDNWQCPQCRLLNEAQKPVHASLQQQQRLQLADAPDESLFDTRYPTFTFLIDPNVNMQLWRALNIQQAPAAYYLAPSFAPHAADSAAMLIDGTCPKLALTPTPSPQDAAAFLSRHAHVEVHLAGPAPDVRKLALLVAAAAVTLALVYICYDKLGMLLALRRPMAAVFMAGFIYGTCGAKFNSLQNTPFSGTARDGLPQYVADGFQRQFGAESLILAGVYGSCCLALVLVVGAAYQSGIGQSLLGVTRAADYKQRPNVNDTVTDSAVAGVLSKVTGKATVSLLLCAFVFAFWKLVSVFTFKNANYRYGIVW